MERYNPFSLEAVKNPYPFYQEMRAHDPAHWGVTGDPDRAGTWYMTRHEDVMWVLQDPRFGREVDHIVPSKRTPSALTHIQQHWMILRDPPTHTRLRTLVNKAFTPRRIEETAPVILRAVNGLLDAVQESGHMDVIADLSLLLPTIMVCEMVGIPAEDHRMFVPWAIALAKTVDLKQTADVQENGLQALDAMMAYLKDLIPERRRNPQSDLLSALIQARENDRQLSEDDIVGTITLLLMAGNEPVMHMIGNAVLGLVQHPDQRRWFQTHPEMLERASEELLRYDSCVQMTFRYAHEDIELHGSLIRAGDHVAAVLGSALRDPSYVNNPDTLDLTRVNKSSTPYGIGIHYCLGAALARAESNLAVATLFERFPDLELDTDDLQWQHSVAIRGVQQLPIAFSPQSEAVR